MYAIRIHSPFITNGRLCREADYRRITSNPQLGLFGIKLTINALPVEVAVCYIVSGWSATRKPAFSASP